MRFLLFLLPFISFSTALFGDRLLRKDTKNPRTGPCVLNDDGLKCNENGYYKTIQCDSDSCYCVTPHTALVAYDTRTTNSRISPKCGACFVYLQKLFANGDPPENSFIPKCDVSKGDFEPVQCDTKANNCYCVDTTTGREIQGTRASLYNTKKMNCMKIDFAIDPYEFPTFEKPDATQPKNVDPVGKPWCTKNRDSGRVCSQNKTSIRYWFDSSTFTCFPFEHKGCGGNENSYRDSSSCMSDCVLMDYFSCAMQSQPARKSSGVTYSCGSMDMVPPGYTTTTTPGPKLTESGCPVGYSCQMGPFFGICCDEKLTNRYYAAYKPVCKNGKPVKIEQHDGYSSAYLGKSCSDNFCPRDHNCETNEFFAYCCPR